MSVLNTEAKKHHTENMAFLDEGLGMQRYDVVKYKQFDKLTDKQLGFFWRPEEVDVSKDSKDFKDLTDHEKHIFTSNLKRQILLDSVQGRAPAESFGSITSLPELENWIITWTFSETIHSRSYTHIIRNIYSDPSKVFDQLLDSKEIVECAGDISKYYDDLIEYSQYYQLLGEGTHTVNGKTVAIDKRELKKKIWLCLNSVNVLEGIRFYVSFACSWAFAELKKMEGNAKIIKFIARDENVHHTNTVFALKYLQKKILNLKQLQKSAKQKYNRCLLTLLSKKKNGQIIKDGPMIGLNSQLLHDYIEWICCKRMTALGVKCPYQTPQANPLPWTQKWISGAEVQVAPQETEISSYVIGGTKQDVSEDTFKGMSL